jgi:hypothetical protein
MPHVQLSQQHQDKQNSMHFTSKTPLEITVPTITMVFIISNLDKGATNNLTIVMRNFVQVEVAQL